MSNPRDLQHYLSLPYTIQLKRQADAWFAEIAELPGCMTQGASAAEAVEMIQDAMALWIEVALELGKPVPEPRSVDDYSGKFVVRVPHSLHRDLVRAAEREGVSLNQFALVALARAVGAMHYEAGAGDYSVQRHEWLDDVDVKTLATRIRKRRAPK